MRKILIAAKDALVQYLNVQFRLFGTPVIAPVSFEKNTVDEEQALTLAPPLIRDKELHWKFRERLQVHYPATFVTELYGARVWGNQGAVITKDNVFFEPVGREYGYSGKDHTIFKQRRIARPVFEPGKMAVIAASGNEVYYHWMLDIVPRVDLLKRSGDFGSIDRFILNYRRLPYQLELLALLGIPEEKIIASTDLWNFHLKTETLVVPSLVSPNDCPSSRACRFLRGLFAGHLSNREPYRKIYLQRTKGRTVVNEPEILDILLAGGFEIVHPETMTVAQQAHLFSEASYVVAPHGAALTNIVFCGPGTKVIDLFSPQWVNPCYWIMAAHLQLRYAYLVGEGKKTREGVDPKNKAAHIQADPEKLRQLMQAMQ